MPRWVPSQAQHSRFMRALDLRLKSCIEDECPTFTREVVPACFSRQNVNRHKMSQPQSDVIYQNIMAECNSGLSIINIWDMLLKVLCSRLKATIGSIYLHGWRKSS